MRPSDAENSTLRVGTYNLYLGADLSLVFGVPDEATLTARMGEVAAQLAVTAFPNRVDALANVICRQDLDLIGLQEVCQWRVNRGVLWDFQSELLAALERAGQPFEAVGAIETFQGRGRVPAGAFGSDEPTMFEVVGSNVILRRVGSPVNLRRSGQGMYSTTLTLPTTVEVPISIERGWCAVWGEMDGEPFRFVNTHTEAYEATSRDGQRDELLSALEGDSDGDALPTVIVGDFNSMPDEVGMPCGWTDAWVAGNGVGDGPTCGQAPDLLNADSQLSERIDYIWSRGFTVDKSWLMGHEKADRTASGRWPSDHAGVVAALRVVGEGLGAPDRERLTARGRS